MFRKPRRFLMVVLAVAMVGGLTAPGALADHNNETKKNGSINAPKIDGPHERIPNAPAPNGLIKAECTFNGTVTQEKFDENNPLNPVHDHVTLSNLDLDCVGAHFDQGFIVQATVGNDGESNLTGEPKDQPKKSDTHGATAVQSWSHSNGYVCDDGTQASAWHGFPHNANKGNISATGPDNATVNDCTNPWRQSWFKFINGWGPGTNEREPGVYAWGQLAWDDVKKDEKEKSPGVFVQLPNCFVATATAVPVPGGSVLFAGTAVIFDAYEYVDLKTGKKPDKDKDPKHIHACDHQKKAFYDTGPSSSGSNGSGGGGTRGPKS